MNITLSRNVSRPPDAENLEFLRIPEPDELRELSLSDRLSFRIGLWLLRRTQHATGARRTFRPDSRRANLPQDPRDDVAMRAYDLHRRLH